MPRRRIPSTTGKRERAIYLSDWTWQLWAEIRRRERVLCAGHQRTRPTAEAVFQAALRLLEREQSRRAERYNVDLSRPIDERNPAPARFEGIPRPEAD